MKRLFAVISILFAWTSLAFGQANFMINTPPFTGTAIGSGYSMANGTLYMPTSASLRALSLPMSYSIDIVDSSFASGVSQYYISNGQDTTTPYNGFVLYFNSGFVDLFHLQNLIWPGNGLTQAANQCDQGSLGTLCWRTSAIGDAKRHNICTVWQSNHGYFYIDGILRDETTNVGTFIAATGNWLFGTQVPASSTFWDFRHYNRALTADECVQLSNLQQANLIPNSGTLTQGLVVHLPLNNCITTGPLVSCADTSGNSNTATNEGAPPVVAITSPSGTQPITVSGTTVSMAATCTDPATPACTKVCYLVDNVLISSTCPTTAPFTFSWDSTKIIDGSHTLTAVGFNIAATTGTSASIAITTSNSVLAKTVWLNSSTGSDSNNCLSSGAACLTFAHIQSAITFLGGDMFNVIGSFTNTAPFKLCGPLSGCTQNFYPSTNTLTVTTTGGACNPFTLTTTGCGVINVSGAHDGIDVINGSNVTIENLGVIGSSSTTPGNFGISVTSSLPVFTTAAGVTITNTFTKDFAYEIFLGGNGTGTITGYVVSDNVATNTTHANPGSLTCIRADAGTQGTLQGNLATQCGGGSGNNGNGILVINYPSPAGASNTLFQFNVVHDFGWNDLSPAGGPVGCYVTNANAVTVQFNECYNGIPNASPPLYAGAIDYDCFDIDNGATNVLVQYNYAHNCPVQSAYNFIMFGFPGGQQSWNNNVARYNIGENAAICINVGGTNTATNSYIYNNTCATNFNRQSSSPSDLPICWESSNTDMTLANNICMYTGTTQADYNNTLTPTSIRMLNNNYYSATATPTWRFNESFFPIQRFTSLSTYQAATIASLGSPGLDVNSLNVNPQFAGTAATGGTCWNSGTSPPAGPQNAPSAGCPAVYQLTTGSPMIGAGVNVGTLSGTPPTNPTLDYFGVSVPEVGIGSGWNIGADGAHH